MTEDNVTVAVPPAYGPETATAVLRKIQDNPESHYQGSFEEVFPTCGTTRCIAGWTQFIHEGHVSHHAFTFAREALGISYEDADALFYEMSESWAVAALEQVSRGESIDWDMIRRNVDRTERPDEDLYGYDGDDGDY